MTLHLIGYWKASLSDPYPFPQEVEAELDAVVRDRVVRYLEDGSLFANYRGYSWCRYGCGENGSAEFSDGVWLWPEGLAHYVREHQVTLPSEFVTHICGATSGSSEPFVGSSGGSDIDESLWIRWAKRFRTPRLDGLLAMARARVTARYGEAIIVRAGRLEKEHGLDPRSCAKAGCMRPALRGVVFCGNCVAEQKRDLFLPSLEMEEMTDLLRRAPWTKDA